MQIQRCDKCKKDIDDGIRFYGGDVGAGVDLCAECFDKLMVWAGVEEGQ